MFPATYPPGYDADKIGLMVGSGDSGARIVDSTGDSASAEDWVPDELPTLFVPPNLVVPLPHEPLPWEVEEPKAVREGRFKRMAKWTTIALLLFVVVGGIVGYRVVQTIGDALPPIPGRPEALLPVESVILAADGSELGRMFAERRKWVPLSEMGRYTAAALVAVEDHRFFEHDGVDYRRLVGASLNSAQGRSEGASTIPMQLARNYFPELKEDNKYERKVKEIVMARRLSKQFDKDQILEWYLNTVAFGHNSFGIEAAAERFFSKTASDLDLAEASLLVGVLKGTSRFDPFSNPALATERRNLVLRRMVETGAVSTAEAQAAMNRPLNLNPTFIDPADSMAPHFVDHVRKEVLRWAERAGFDVARDGLTIHTTLDPAFQTLAQKAVDRETAMLQNIVDRQFGAPGSRAYERFWLERRNVEVDAIRRSNAYRRYRDEGMDDAAALGSVRLDQSELDGIRQDVLRLEAGLVAVDPTTGMVRAWVGGRDYRVDQFDKVAAAKRQPGSTFKPFVFTAAIDVGFSPYYMVEDRLRTFTDSRGKMWTPTNSGGGVTGRLYTLKQGLAWSKNTVAIHLTDRMGPQRVAEMATKMGVESTLLPVPSLALGTSEVSLLELVSGYVTLADMGVRHRPVVITSIEDRWGRTVATFTDNPERVLSTQTSYTMVDMMRTVVDAGTGSLIRNGYGVRGDLAGKTGTTQNNADGWFVLMHSDMVTGAWVGFNDPRIAFESDYWGQGGHNALRLVGDFAKGATSGSSPLLGTSRFRAPAGYRPPRVPVQTPIEDPQEDSAVPERLTPRNSRPADRLPITRLPISGNPTTGYP